MYSVLEDEIVYDQDRVATLPILFKQNTTNFTKEEVFWAGMNAVEAVGGMYVKPGVMLLNDITPLLKFESSVFLNYRGIHMISVQWMTSGSFGGRRIYHDIENTKNLI